MVVLIRRKINWAIAIALWCLLVLSLGAVIAQRDRPIFFLFDYQPIHYLRDAQTGKIVELGTLQNFGSLAFEVGVYDDINPSRSKFSLVNPVISVVGGHGFDSLEVQFDGQCYFVRSHLRRESDKVKPTWEDPKTGSRLCFYVLTPLGEKITRTEDIRQTAM